VKSLLDVLDLASGYLKKAGVIRPKREAEDLMAHVLKCDRMALYLDFERPLAQEELDSFRDIIRKRAEGTPYGYLVGEVSFFGAHLHVSPDVLIPRHETELLVEKVAQTLSREDRQGKHLWDVCCGSGALGISLKKRFPQLSVTLADISKEALKVAQKNADHNEVDVAFVQGDLLAPFEGRRVDYFLCNPPYLSEVEYLSVEKEVKREPRLALVGGVSGVEFYARLAEVLECYLNPGAKGWLEIGAGQGSIIKNLFEYRGYRTRVESDLAGIERFFFLERDT
jgi:release factor glutamine methyltransferase